MLPNLTTPSDKFELQLVAQEQQFKPPFQADMPVHCYIPLTVSKNQIILLPK